MNIEIKTMKSNNLVNHLFEKNDEKFPIESLSVIACCCSSCCC